MERFDVVIIGAGAAGMMCALEAGRRGQRVLLLDRNKSPGEKIRISGGGRCNFTNLDIRPEAYLSQNPKFALSALSRYTQWDFIDLLAQNNIAWHEKTLGQLFCDGSARQIVDLFVAGIEKAGVEMRLSADITDLNPTESGWELVVNGANLHASAVVVACGGRSIPKMGASGFGYQLAQKFGLELVKTRAALVPLTFADSDLTAMKELAGLSVPAVVSCNGARFAEGMLFTHRGLSGPSILQVSSYWQDGSPIEIDLAPGQDAIGFLRSAKQTRGRLMPASALAELLPRRLAQLVAQAVPTHKRLADLTDQELAHLASAIKRWQVTPNGSEGYRTAEVTLGGVSTSALNARTMEAKNVPGLYFIGEVVDVTGWLGGYNFQWAWSSGWAAGQVV